MRAPRFDVLVVGSGPAGSIAALVLARGGARVALMDKATFPRDKACGDLVGPRGLQLLDDLHVALPPSLDVGDMVVIGPSGRRVRLPCAEGFTFPGRGTAVTRRSLDAALRDAALDAGAVEVVGRAGAALEREGRLDGFSSDRGSEVRADIVVGADGATSHVAGTAALVEPSLALWGFAVRAYVEQTVDVPVIVLWDRGRWNGFPGYGWIFPGPGGGANVGIGVGTLGDRRRGAEAVKALPAFLDHLRSLGVLDGQPGRVDTLGGWLKMGMVGTCPGRGNVLLVGDAAGLVNPLQGEGIAQAMTSGRAAAAAVLDRPARPVPQYRWALAEAHLPYHRITAALQRGIVPRPRAVAGLGRVLTAPGLGRALAPGWAVFWNELVGGAPPSRARRLVAVAGGCRGRRG